MVRLNPASDKSPTARQNSYRPPDLGADQLVRIGGQPTRIAEALPDQQCLGVSGHQAPSGRGLVTGLAGLGAAAFHLGLEPWLAREAVVPGDG